MIRHLAEETVNGSAFDDFSASSMLAIIGRQVGVMSNCFVESPRYNTFPISDMSNLFVQNPNDTTSCRRNS